MNKLEDSLRQRGVKVWRDKNEIRPGDLFASSLEAGLDTSRSVGIVVTPASLKSDWVRDEYYRALSLANQRRVRLIPLFRGGTKLPGFLSSRQCVDFRNESTFESRVDSLVWPGITGHRILFYALHPRLWYGWPALASELYRTGVNVFNTYTAYVEHGAKEIRGLLEAGDRVVVMTDVCCDFPWVTGRWRALTGCARSRPFANMGAPQTMRRYSFYINTRTLLKKHRTVLLRGRWSISAATLVFQGAFGTFIERLQT